MPKRIDWEEEERPGERDNYFTLPLENQMVEAGVKRAGSKSKLRAVLRAMLFLWVQDEFPTPPDDVIEQQGRRAQKKSKRG